MDEHILESFQQRLGHQFKKKDLLILALTHASLRTGTAKSGTTTDDNERLEFLGDRVLALVIAEWLESLFPDAREGELAKRFNRLVRKESLVDIAKRLDLGNCIFMSPSEEDNGGRNKGTILADACEAVLGALFLDSDYETVRGIIRKHWDVKIDLEEKAPIDPKSALQEWVLARREPLPKYIEISRSGPAHKPHFVSEVRVGDIKPSRGEGGSKRIAEQNAARLMLLREGVWEPQDDS